MIRAEWARRARRPARRERATPSAAASSRGARFLLGGGRRRRPGARSAAGRSTPRRRRLRRRRRRREKPPPRWRSSAPGWRPDRRPDAPGRRRARDACTRPPRQVGGRVHSNATGYWQDGQVSEWCGELINTDHQTMLRLARRFGLATVDLHAAQAPGCGGRLPRAGRALPGRRGRPRVPGGVSAPPPGPRRGGRGDHAQDADARGRRARPHERPRVDRGARARRRIVARSAGCSTWPTRSSTARRRRTSRR